MTYDLKLTTYDFLNYMITGQAVFFQDSEIKTPEALSKLYANKESLDCTQLSGLIPLNYIAVADLPELTRQISLNANRKQNEFFQTK